MDIKRKINYILKEDNTLIDPKDIVDSFYKVFPKFKGSKYDIQPIEKNFEVVITKYFDDHTNYINVVIFVSNEVLSFQIIPFLDKNLDPWYFQSAMWMAFNFSIFDERGTTEKVMKSFKTHITEEKNGYFFGVNNVLTRYGNNMSSLRTDFASNNLDEYAFQMKKNELSKKYKEMMQKYKKMKAFFDRIL